MPQFVETMHEQTATQIKTDKLPPFTEYERLIQTSQLHAVETEDLKKNLSHWILS